MRIEIDFSKPEALRKQKRELEMALATVNSALAALNGNGPELAPVVAPWKPDWSAPVGTFMPTPVPKPEAAPPVEPKPETEPVQSLPEPFDTLPDQFSMTEGLKVAEAGNYSLASFRRFARKLVEEGRLILVEKGKGRRPSIYRKA